MQGDVCWFTLRMWHWVRFGAPNPLKDLAGSEPHIFKAMDCSPRKLLPWAWISQERLPMHQEVGFDARELDDLISEIWSWRI